MKDTNENTRDLIQSKCFECLVEQGLENATTRIFGAATGLSDSSLYYWFKDKADIILNSTMYGINSVIENLFADAYTYLNDIDVLFEVLPKSVLNYKKQSRLVYQALTSPQYGDKLREIQERPFVQLFISTMTNYILWEDKIKMDSQLSEIHSRVKMLVSGNQAVIVWQTKVH